MQQLRNRTLYMLDLFYKGGPLMYPLLFGSVLMVAIIIERGYHFIRAKVKRNFLESVTGAIEEGDLDGAEGMARRSRGPVAAIVETAIRYRNFTQDVVENKISLRGDQELKRLSKNLHLLELTGKIAPMIGLLGTVIGMVEAFREVSAVQNLVDPSLLAGGIWEALITTVAGLFVGIPALVFYHLYTNQVKATAFAMKHIGEDIMSMTRGRQ
jgi:biopolymer transport protein ExbB